MARKVSPLEPGEFWSFLKHVLDTGARIERTCETLSLGYEGYSAKTDEAARKLADKFLNELNEYLHETQDD